MESIVKEFVDASLDLSKAECRLVQTLYERLDVHPTNIKSISLKNTVRDTQVVQIVVVDLIGSNEFRSESFAGINGLTIVTPNRIEINASEMDL